MIDIQNWITKYQDRAYWCFIVAGQLRVSTICEDANTYFFTIIKFTNRKNNNYIPTLSEHCALSDNLLCR